MVEQWQKLTTHELIELYNENVITARNSDNEIPLLSICAVYAIVRQGFPLTLNKIDSYFFNTLSDSIYDLNVNSLLIKTAVNELPQINKLEIIDTIGLLGIENMSDNDSNQLMSISSCISILYLIYSRDNNCDLSNFISSLSPNIQVKIQSKLHINNSTNLDNKKFSNVNEYYQFLCDKLNENGYKYPNPFSDELWLWEVRNHFMTTLTVNHPYEFQAFKFLKDNGYLNLGICPNCGSPITDVKYTYTSGFNSNINYPICKSCYDRGREVSMNPASDKKGCYIATVCYGDINSSEVVMFRKYRDEVLSKNIFGRIFIGIYYFLSPSIANYLKGKQILNNKIRLHFLDAIYKKLVKRYV